MVVLFFTIELTKEKRHLKINNSEFGVELFDM